MLCLQGVCLRFVRNVLNYGTNEHGLDYCINKYPCVIVVFQMSIEGSGKQDHGSETKLDIPPDTVLAYSVMEISIDTEGCFGQ